MIINWPNHAISDL